MLVYYFTHSLVPCFSLHKTHQDKFCSNLVPMALDEKRGPHLLAAILYSASAHRKSRGLDESDRTRLEYLQFCLATLRQQTLGEDSAVDDTYIATALLLSVSEILLGGEKRKTWRAHLTGAIAALESSRADTHQISGVSSTRLFLRRWSQSLSTIALSSAQSYSRSSPSDFGPTSPATSSSDFINMFDGFSTRLSPMFQEIHDLADQAGETSALAKQSYCDNDYDPFLQSSLLERARELIESIQASMAETIHETDPYVQPGQDINSDSEFKLLNTVYHWIALLEVYQRVLDRPRTSPDVEDAVAHGIQCLEGLRLSDSACPGVATLHPVFIIGCSVHQIKDRLFVLDWLGEMRRRYAMGNVTHARYFLLELWKKNDSLEPLGGHLQWNQLMGTFSVTSHLSTTDRIRSQRLGSAALLRELHLPMLNDENIARALSSRI